MKNPFDNPIYWLDSRARVRERRLWVLGSFFMAVPLVISLLLVVGAANSNDNPFPDLALTISGVAVFSHGALLVLLSALGAAQRISQERERRTFAALVNSPLEAKKIATGKLLGAWRFTAWLAVLTLPFLAVSTLWGGFSPARLAICWCMNLAAALATASLALGFSGLFGRSLSAYLATGAALFLWCAVVPAVCGIAWSFIDVSPSAKTAMQLQLSVTAYHLPLAPQVWLFGDFTDSSSGWFVFGTAFLVWSAIALLGRVFAVRGLQREIY